MDGAVGTIEERLFAAPLNHTKQLQLHPAIQEERELIPNEHLPDKNSLNTPISSSKFNNKCSPRLNSNADYLISVSDSKQ
jgi:hypothetical protein